MDKLWECSNNLFVPLLWTHLILPTCTHKQLSQTCAQLSPGPAGVSYRCRPPPCSTKKASMQTNTYEQEQLANYTYFRHLFVIRTLYPSCFMFKAMLKVEKIALKFVSCRIAKCFHVGSLASCHHFAIWCLAASKNTIYGKTVAAASWPPENQWANSQRTISVLLSALTEGCFTHTSRDPSETPHIILLLFGGHDATTFICFQFVKPGLCETTEVDSRGESRDNICWMLQKVSYDRNPLVMTS